MKKPKPTLEPSEAATPETAVPADAPKDPVTVSGRLLLWAGLAWIVFVFVLYVMTLRKTQLAGFRQVVTYAYLWEFFDWQVLGFLVFAMGPVLLGIKRFRGGLTVGYLAFSSAALLAASRQWALPLAFAGFAAWTVASIETLRIGLRRWVDPECAGFGIGAALLFAVWIPAAFLLGSAKILMLPAAAPLCIALAAPGAVALVRGWRERLRKLADSAGRLDPFGLAGLEAIWFMCALTFAWSCTPEAASDSIRQYLPVIRMFAIRHSLEQQYIDWGRLMPKAIQAALAPAYMIGGYQAVKWFAWFSVVALTVLMAEETYRRTKRPGLALFGGAALLACPLLLHLAVIVYMDHFIALLAFAGFIALFRGLNSGNDRPVWLGAFLMGCVGQIKYNAIIFCIVWSGAAAIGLIYRKGFGRGLARAALAGLIVAAVAAPWYLFTYHMTGSPVFPFMNNVFHSPYWPKGDPAKFNLDSYEVGKDKVSWLLFPWHVAFHTSRIGEMVDGYMGFWLLGLLPFLALNAKRLRQSGILMGLAGIAMVAGVSHTTQYGRYWLPAMPLLLMPMLVSMGRLLDRGTRNAHPKLAVPLAIPWLGALLLPSSLWAMQERLYSWDAYVGSMPREQYMNTITSSRYAMVKEINGWIDPDAGVLCTGYESIYTFEARAFEFPFWRSNVAGLATAADLDRFIKANGLKYWFVDYEKFDDTTFYNDRYRIQSTYWSPSRIVAARGPCVLYDLSDRPKGEGYQAVETREIAPVLTPLTKNLVLDSGWQDAQAADKNPAEQKEGFILTHPGHNLNYVFSIPAGADACRVLAAMDGAASGHYGVYLTLAWYDGDAHQLGSDSGGVSADLSYRKFSGRIASRIPIGAKYGRLVLMPFSNSLPVDIRTASIEFRARE